MSDGFGEKVSAAYEFLVEVFEDIGSIMNTLTQDLADSGLEGWHPMRLPSGRITFVYGALYAPAKDRLTGNYRYAILMQMEVQRAITNDEPQLLAVAVDFGNAASDQTVWNEWTTAGGRRVMNFVRSRGGSAAIPADVLQPDFAPTGKRAIGVVVPICTLRNRDELRARLSEPIMKAIRSIGYADTSKP